MKKSVSLFVKLSHLNYLTDHHVILPTRGHTPKPSSTKKNMFYGIEKYFVLYECKRSREQKLVNE